MSLDNQLDASDNKDTAREASRSNENRLETSIPPAPEGEITLAERAAAVHALLNDPESRKTAQDAGYGHEWARAESACYRLLSEIEQGLGGEER